MSSVRFDEFVPNFLLPLGDAIRTCRLELGLSQEALADKCGFDRTYISLLERGQRNPSFSNLLRIASGLNVSVTKLIEAYENGTYAN